MEKFKFKKKFGQNFLIDKNILNIIQENINVNSNDLIIEIGAGSGILTKKLLKLNTNVLAYEIDMDTKMYLEKLKHKKLKVIYDDFLKRDILSDLKNYNIENIFVVGNLPYYITTAIIEKIIKSNLPVKEMLFMVQKEVANRLSAKPGSRDYSYFTAYLNFNYNIKKISDVSKNSFYPVPKVESSIIKLKKHNLYNIKNEPFLIEVLKKSFKHKRKTLLNNLKEYDQKKIKEILIRNNFDLLVRPEKIPLKTYIDISNAL